MDHEYLFRGKRLDDGEWVEGFYVGASTNAPYHEIFVPIDEFCTPWERRVVDPDTVGPYIGLTDKNGMKIFEGDILASRYDEAHPEDITIEVVVWAHNGWCVKTPGGDSCPLDEDGVLPYSEVIGNIYDNPELLKEG